jgi:hypothetical protein
MASLGRPPWLGCALALGALGMLETPFSARAGRAPGPGQADVGASPAAAALLLERIVAVVDKDVITAGERLAEARLALVWREGEAGAQAVPDAAFLHAFTDYLIGQVLVARESRRMGAPEVTDDEVDARLEALRAAFVSERAYDAFVQQLTIDPAHLRAVLARDLRNDRYIAQRLRTRLFGRTGAGAAAQASEARQQALAAWVGELRRAVQVRRLDADGKLQLEREG